MVLPTNHAQHRVDTTDAVPHPWQDTRQREIDLLQRCWFSWVEREVD